MPLTIGAIVMWSGAVIDIPEGWALCDGTNDTLDLRNKFIVGAGNTFVVGDTGGFTDATLVSHNHSLTINSGGNHTHNLIFQLAFNSGPVLNFAGTSSANRALGNQIMNTSTGAGSHSHTVSLNNAGVSATNANLPPYYALAFIQQVE